MTAGMSGSDDRARSSSRSPPGNPSSSSAEYVSRSDLRVGRFHKITSGRWSQIRVVPTASMCYRLFAGVNSLEEELCDHVSVCAEVNEQWPVNPTPASTTRSLSYTPPRPPQLLRKHSLHCYLLVSHHALAYNMP